ncbi:NAD(P)-dependent oxidoreductase [Gehongia tenuis]|uniref:Hydroxyacid dehydrogenase n=1 Tax=Gehongia tenuis TaxID=2763655 RepID=A0A926HPK4_9FIRM|nr:NAD(P)-dependent oxidoreductase [Gehongia tenuis]MBC8530795.1 hydroxyacid dehydrogenase [Gehongia tenuis]
MKIVGLEPLGVSQQKLKECIATYLPATAEIELHDRRPKDEDEAVSWAKDADVIIVANMPLRRNVLEKCPKVRMISVAFTGVDHVDVMYCHERGMVVSNCAGYSTQAVAELVIGMVIALYRKLDACGKAVRSGGTSAGLKGRELRGKIFGIIGTGAIGLRTAELARAFGCTILAFSRTQRDIEGVQYVSLETLLKESDIVSVHVPATAETRGMLDGEKLRLMKPSAVLINCARGPIVDAGDLQACLKEGVIAGAGIDVYDIEPPIPKDNPLLTAPNVVLAPHIGFLTEEALEERCDLCFNNVTCWLNDAPVNLV